MRKGGIILRKTFLILLFLVTCNGIVNAIDAPWLNAVSYKAGPFTVHVNTGSDSGVISAAPTQEQKMTIYRAYIGNIGIQLISQQAALPAWTSDRLVNTLIASGVTPNSIQTVARAIDGHPGIIGQGSLTTDTPHETNNFEGRLFIVTYTTYEVFEGVYNVTQNISCIISTTGSENFDQFMSAVNTIHIEKTLLATKKS